MRAKIHYGRVGCKLGVCYLSKETTGSSSQSPILTLRTMPTYCFLPLVHAGISSNWESSRTLNQVKKTRTVTGTIILWIEALFAVGRCSPPHSQGVAAVVPLQAQEGGQEGLGGKHEHDRRDRHDVFGVQ
jgi:hypothetical protein